MHHLMNHHALLQLTGRTEPVKAWISFGLFFCTLFRYSSPEITSQIFLFPRTLINRCKQGALSYTVIRILTTAIALWVSQPNCCCVCKSVFWVTLKLTFPFIFPFFWQLYWISWQIPWRRSELQICMELYCGDKQLFTSGMHIFLGRL